MYAYSPKLSMERILLCARMSKSHLNSFHIAANDVINSRVFIVHQFYRRNLHKAVRVRCGFDCGRSALPPLNCLRKLVVGFQCGVFCSAIFIIDYLLDIFILFIRLYYRLFFLL